MKAGMWSTTVVACVASAWLASCAAMPVDDDAAVAPDTGAPDVSIAPDSPCMEQSFFEDRDGDGQGDPGREVRACERPDGAVDNADDCDDDCATCHTGGVEVCDGVDQDCDGRVDEGVTTDYYIDADGDGHGAPIGTPTAACTAPVGRVPSADDCDDTCPTCFPGGVEICDTELRDENCAGGANEGCACTAGSSRDCPGGSDTGACVAGLQTCTPGGTWGSCEGDVGPSPETCDGIDEDCDGIVDGTEASCAPLGHATAACVDARCTIGSCDSGYFDCNGDPGDGCETVGACSTCPPGCAWGCTGTECRAAVMVTTGRGFSCALRDDGRVACWGVNDVGQLGSATPPFSRRAQLVPGLSGVTSVRAFHSHACAIHDGGRLTCWGSSVRGELGRGLGGPVSGVPMEVLMPSPVVELSGGIAHTCARLADGSVMCTGDNDSRALGTGDTTDRYMFTPVVDLMDAVSLSGGATGIAYSCAVRANGRVVCWGNCREYQCGTGRASYEPRPVEMLGVANAVQVVAGERHVCVLLADTSVMCLGWSAEGQVGDGTTTRHMAATPVPGLIGVEAMTAWAASFAMVGSTAWVWGQRGLLGASYPANQLVPVRNPLLDGFVSMHAANDHVCAVRAGAVWCWGSGSTLGDGVDLTNPEPQRTLPPP